MAQHNNYGALGSLTRDEFESLSLGVQGLNNPINIMGKSIPRNDVLMGGLGMVSGLPTGIGSAIGQYKAQDAANKLLNRETDFFDTLKGINTGVQDVRNEITNRGFDQNNDGIISNFELNRFGQTIPGVDLAPMYNYKKDDLGNPAYSMVSKNAGRPYMESGKTMPADATANPYSSGSFAKYGDDYKKSLDDMQQRYNEDEEFKSSMGSYAMRDMQSRYDDNLKSSIDYAGDAINQTNITNYDPSKGQYDKNYADAVTRESQGDSVGAESTFICTALYEMGDMKKSIYKYDSMYGKKINSAIYRGYALWGEPLAKQIKKKGLVYKLIKPIALTWANQMAYDLSKGKTGKNSLAMKITKTIGEGCCYILGQIFKRRTLWLKST